MELSKHARFRSAQRNISPRVVRTVLQYGRLIRGRDCEAFFVGEREVNRARISGIEIAFARNTQVVCGHDGVVITLYRTNRPMREIASRRVPRRLRRAVPIVQTLRGEHFARESTV